MHPAVRIALEWFNASGEKTRPRLDSLVAHYAEQAGITGEHLAQLQQDAWNGWQDGERVLGRLP